MIISNIYQWINKEKSRYYTIAIQNLSLNKIVLNYSWGGCNSNRGGKKTILAKSDSELQAIVDCMMKRRKSRGYILITP